MTSGVRRVARLTIYSGLARVPGFLVPLLIGATLGAGLETDAYFLAYGAVLLVGGVLAQGVESAFVPFAARNEGRQDYQDTTASRVALVALLAWVVIVPLVVVAAPSALVPRVRQLALLLTPMVVLWPVCSVYTGALIARWRIAEASTSMLWRGAGAILGVGVALGGGGLPAVAIGLGLGEVARLVWLRRQVARTPVLEAREPAAVQRGFGTAATAQVLSGATGSLVYFAERLIATTLGAGGVSLLEYAARLLLVPALLFEGGMAPLLLARWSNNQARDLKPSASEVSRSVGKGIAVAIVIAVLVAALAPPVVRLLLGHGSMTSGDLSAIAGLLRLLAAGFVATMGALLLERLYLAHSRNGVLASLSVVRGLVRIGTVVVLLPTYGLTAFALGYLVADWLYLIVLIGNVRRSGLVAAYSPAGQQEIRDGTSTH
jgi:putative peptidoglycan lipid II flippase